MLIDTHCHLTYPQLAPQVDAVLERAGRAGVENCITIATSPADALAAVTLAGRFPQVSVAAGIHPHEAGKATDADLEDLARLHREHADPSAATPLVAVGETGLDFHYELAPPAAQERVFRFQLELALECDRPVVVHARQAERRVCEILAEMPALKGRAVFHCFSAGPAEAEAILAGGWWISYTGIVTFENAAAVRAALALTPLDRMMLETDAPFLSPAPVRKQRPCEPAFVAHTAKYVAGLRNMTLEELARATTANARRFFGLAPPAAG